MQPSKLGRFVLLQPLGQGGMGVVYAAYDPQLDRRVALKILRPGHGKRSAKLRERLLREAQALARLSHPNVVPLHDVGVIEGQVFLVMEYIAGKNLRAWAAQAEKPRSWQELLAVYRQAGQGLAAAHAAGLVHRDFKPENVLIGDDGRVRVLDFGLARAQTDTVSSPGDGGDGGGDIGDIGPEDSDAAPRAEDSGAPGSDGKQDTQADIALDTRIDSRFEAMPGASLLVATRSIAPDGASLVSSLQSLAPAPMHEPLTEVGVLLGTPAYMAPEQYSGGAVGPAADQFSFCVALYEALYGQKPFAADHIAYRQVLMHQGTVTPPPANTQVPRWIFPVLARGLKADPAERYPSMNALLGDLSQDREGDLGLTRRAAARYLGVFSAASAVMVTLASRSVQVDASQPVSLSMFLINLSSIGAFLVGVAIWRRALMINEVSRKLVLMMVMSSLLLVCQRGVGWLLGVSTGEQVVAELFSSCMAALIGMLGISWRLAVVALWTFACMVAVVLWPQLLNVWLSLAPTGILILSIWVWFSQRVAVAQARL